MNVQSPSTYSSEQITAWIRGLLTVAWSDGKFSDTEKALIEQLMAEDLPPHRLDTVYDPISAQDLAQTLQSDAAIAENFLRTAVMVALADGVYSSAEDQILESFGQALNIQVPGLDALRHTLDGSEGPISSATALDGVEGHEKPAPDLLAPVRHWLDDLEMHDPRVARFLCQLIPPQCPFERDIVLFGRKIVHIPPMCKINPLYEQLVSLRFRALSYLADDCKEDVSKYC
ncbi:MAG TPA: Mo-dependent nitrogenase C-terminal domain-containing protein [Stenomitos sp.]